jgi:hypothetical protein
MSAKACFHNWEEMDNIAIRKHRYINTRNQKKSYWKNAPDWGATLIALDDFNSGGGTSAPSGSSWQTTLTELFDMTINKVQWHIPLRE